MHHLWQARISLKSPHIASPAIPVPMAILIPLGLRLEFIVMRYLVPGKRALAMGDSTLTPVSIIQM